MIPCNHVTFEVEKHMFAKWLTFPRFLPNETRTSCKTFSRGSPHEDRRRAGMNYDFTANNTYQRALGSSLVSSRDRESQPATQVHLPPACNACASSSGRRTWCAPRGIPMWVPLIHTDRRIATLWSQTQNRLWLHNKYPRTLVKAVYSPFHLLRSKALG